MSEIIQSIEQWKSVTPEDVRSPYAEVDGHDVGQGKFNIFIVPKDSWGQVLERVHGLLKLRGLLNTVMVAKQLKGSGKFLVAWPADFSVEFGL